MLITIKLLLLQQGNSKHVFRLKTQNYSCYICFLVWGISENNKEIFVFPILNAQKIDKKELINILKKLFVREKFWDERYSNTLIFGEHLQLSRYLSASILSLEWITCIIRQSRDAKIADHYRPLPVKPRMVLGTISILLLKW